MKTFVLPLAILACVTTSLLSVAEAAPSAIRIRVEQNNKTDLAKHTRTQRRSLNVYVTNSGPETAELKIKFAIYGRDAESRDIVTVAQGESAATVASKGTEKVETAPATAVSQEEHKVKKKTVEASGAKIVGHAVQVLQGDAVVAEFYDPASMKEQWGKAPAAAKAADKPEKK